MSERIWLGYLVAALSCACGGGSSSGGFHDGSTSSGGSGGSSGSGGSGGGTSTNTGGGSGGGGTGLALDDVPQAYSEAFCGIVERCNPLILALLSPAECQDYFVNSFVNQGFGDIVDAVAAGRVSYDGVAMQACVDEFAAQSCDELDDGDSENCDRAAVGSVELGAECTTDVECEGDAICDFSNSCPGTCSARLNAGDPCSGDDQCKDGLICSDDTARCVMPAQQGEDCEGGEAPVCDGDRLFCLGADEDEGRPGTCRYIDEVFSAEPGEACDFTNGPLCVEGSACAILSYDIDSQTAELECVPVVKAEETCNFGAVNACEPGHYCAGVELEALDFEGTCEPSLADGQECDPDVLGMCGFAALCQSSGSGSARCVALKDNGVSCETDAECWSGNCVAGGCAPTSACDD